MAPLIGLLCLLSGIWFLFGMPVLTAVSAWEYYQKRKSPTGFLVAVVMLIVFYISAGLIWMLITPDWNLSFLTTFEASVNSEKYGHPIEHRAEVMLCWLLIVSTLTSVAAGSGTAAIARAWIRRRCLAA
jgi:hypothetical protein